MDNLTETLHRIATENRKLKALLKEKEKKSKKENLISTTCTRCGKTYTCIEAMLRHQRRSKICNRIKNFPSQKIFEIEHQVKKHLGSYIVKMKKSD